MKFKAQITNDRTVIESACTVTEMLSCVTMIANNLYTHLPDDETKAFFKFAFKKVVNDDVPFIDHKAREKVAKKYAEEIEKGRGEKETTDGKLDEIMEKMRILKGLLDDD